MIQMYFGDVLIVGVTRGNIDRLTAGNPLKLDIVPHKQPRTVLVAFGETKPDILALMDEAGYEVPQALRDSAAADPW